jgi:hypothetical protein
MKAKNLRLMDEGFGGVRQPVKRKRKRHAVVERQDLTPVKSFNDQPIPSDRVAPGAPNPPPQMLSPAPTRWIKKKASKAKMKHGQY